MLKKINRGLTRVQVAELFSKDAMTASNALFRIRWKSAPQAFPQFVVITTPTLHRSAVQRNRVRRRVYEWIRLNLKDWTKGIWVAILCKKPVLMATYQELGSALHQLFHRIS